MFSLINDYFEEHLLTAAHNFVQMFPRSSMQQLVQDTKKRRNKGEKFYEISEDVLRKERQKEK